MGVIKWLPPLLLLLLWLKVVVTQMLPIQILMALLIVAYGRSIVPGEISPLPMSTLMQKQLFRYLKTVVIGPPGLPITVVLISSFCRVLVVLLLPLLGYLRLVPLALAGLVTS